MRSSKLFAAVAPAAALAAVVSLFGASAAAQTLLPLVRYQSKGGVGAYAAHPEHRKKFQANPSKWSEYGTVGYCQAAKQAGTMPLLNLRRPTEFGAEHFYTTDAAEAVKVQSTDAKWVVDDFDKGVVCHVATSKLPGTVPVYRYRDTGGGAYLYTFGDGENNVMKQNPNLKFERVAFYVWAQAGPVQSNFPDPGPKQSDFPDPAPQKPDLTVGNVGVFKNGKVIFGVRNNGFAINQRAFVVRMTAYDRNGHEAWSTEKTVAPVIAKGSLAEQSLETPEGKSLFGVRLKVTVDARGAIDETDETNNTSDFVDGLPPVMPGPVIDVPPRRTLPAPQNVPAPAASTDLKLRPALYFNGAETARVNTASRYATPERALTLKKSEAVSCDGDVCTFNLGFFAQRGAAGGELSTYALLRGRTFGIVGNTVLFAAGETSKPVVHAVRLKTGENVVVVEIDPERKLAESDEANNSFQVTVVVEP